VLDSNQGLIDVSVVFLSSPDMCWGSTSLSHDGFIPNTCPFIIHRSSYHSTLHIIDMTASLNKLQVDMKLYSNDGGSAFLRNTGEPLIIHQKALPFKVSIVTT
jgi:hypothetical protein